MTTQHLNRSKWPKKQPVAEYILRNYTEGGVSNASVVRQIKKGTVPGIKFGGRWYVYVLPDGSPAWGYSENQPAAPQAEKSVKLTGNPVADAILAKTAANTGMKVA